MIITLEMWQEIQVWRLLLITSAIGKWGQEELEVKAILGYNVISRTVRANETLSQNKYKVKLKINSCRR